MSVCIGLLRRHTIRCTRGIISFSYYIMTWVDFSLAVCQEGIYSLFGAMILRGMDFESDMKDSMSRCSLENQI